MATDALSSTLLYVYVQSTTIHTLTVYQLRLLCPLVMIVALIQPSKNFMRSLSVVV